MNSAEAARRPFTQTDWLIILVAIIGFAFDTYELLMLPVIAGPALAEILQVPPNNPLVTQWVGNMLWITALCGGVFGLLGGWLTDRFGRKTVLAGSIMVYSLSPVLASLSTSLAWFMFFRCTTFVGVCVEFVAAITWLAELFPDKGRKEKVLGWTQAFASVGGLMVTVANMLAVKYANILPGLPVPEPFNAHASWRYTLMTGLLPAIPIALMLPFVPESRVWQEKRKAGTLRRPSIFELFSPELRRVTLVTAGLSACAYGAAFGALQLTPTRIVPGLADLAEQRTALLPLRKEATALNAQLDEAQPRFEQACAEVAGLKELSGQRSKVRAEIGGVRRGLDSPLTPDTKKAELQTQLGALTNQLSQLDAELHRLTESKPEAGKALTDREKILGQIAANRARQDPFDTPIKARGNTVQLWQELGGLSGRIALAILLAAAISRKTLLRLFQAPGLVVVPLTYLYLFRNEPGLFQLGMAAAGFLTVAQFSYFGEYLPKAFPLHLRGTGASFATNVGGRMIGTSAAFVTASLVAPQLAGSTFEQVATGAAIVGTAVFLIGLALSFWLPEPKEEKPAA
ncbi:MAG: MFS transporter [Verrucomicrobia bacterium]|nr:MFS transporter [Verrucomicrobiota bacterium]